MDCSLNVIEDIVLETNMTLECFIGKPIMPSQDFVGMDACLCCSGKHTVFNTNSSIVP